MEALIEIGIFVSKVLIVVVGIVAVILAITAVSVKAKGDKHPEIEDLSEKYKEQKNALLSVVMEEKDFKLHSKNEKAAKREKKNTPDTKHKLFVIDFLKGDVQASQVDRFREEITAVLSVATPQDSILINVESPGGVVHGYGLAAAQILRLRDANLNVTVAVDKIAASGGYMMACVANQIISSPFAIIGSIGVVAQVPNFHRLLKKNEVDYKEYTAGDYKRTVSIFGEITEKGEQKFLQQLEQTHVLFKTFVGRFRPNLKMEEIATGEYWFGLQALEKGLVDKIMTSDEYLQSKLNEFQVFKVVLEKKPSLSQKVTEMFEAASYAVAQGITNSFMSHSKNFGFKQQKQFQVLADIPDLNVPENSLKSDI